MDERLVAALIAGGVSLIVGTLSILISRWQVSSQLRQAQLANILTKRIESYSILWSIHIRYETNWTLEGKLKDREWVDRYLSELSEFNVNNGLFFTQDLYEKFGELRTALLQARMDTPGGQLVEDVLAHKIRSIVYGELPIGKKPIPGLSTILKDDLGSYRGVALQRRAGGND